MSNTNPKNIQYETLKIDRRLRDELRILKKPQESIDQVITKLISLWEENET